MSLDTDVLHGSLQLGFRILRDLNTAYARKLRKAFRADPKSLKSVPPPDLNGPAEMVRRNWCAYNLLRKVIDDSLVSQDERRQKAVDGWREDERLNRETTVRLRTSTMGPIQVDGRSLLFEVKRLITQVLGPYSWDEVLSNSGFSPGSSTRLPRSEGRSVFKLSRGRDGRCPHVTPLCLPYALAAILGSPAWVAYFRDAVGPNPCDWLEVVPGGEFFTVGKDFDVDRTAEKQPEMNLYLQKGQGKTIRDRLRRSGIDLNDQSHNARAALQASLHDLDCTIDLRSASNSVTLQLVRECFPDDWFDALCVTRTEWTRIDEKWTFLSMISSMGNGFTFELETLIFWAMARVIESYVHPRNRRPVLVYGDDIIVGKANAGWLVELLQYAGFRVNIEKSFFAGPFRESCGTHAYNGIDVTPFRITKPLTLPRVVVLANAIQKWSEVGGVCDPLLYKVWADLVVGHDSLYNSPFYGDSVIHMPRHRWLCRKARRRLAGYQTERQCLSEAALLVESLMPKPSAPCTLPLGERVYVKHILSRTGVVHHVHGSVCSTTETPHNYEEPSGFKKVRAPVVFSCSAPYWA